MSSSQEIENLDEKSASNPNAFENKKFRIIPTLFTNRSYRVMGGTGVLIGFITSIFVALALKQEMAGLFLIRPYDVSFFIFTVCSMVFSAILLYPFLAMHFRERILVEERLGELNKLWEKGHRPFLRDIRDQGFEQAKKNAKAEHPWFWYLYNITEEHFTVTPEKTDSNQTYSQKVEDFRRGLIRATAVEDIEDSTFGIASYELPVVVCMLSVGIGFIVFSLVPFLGTGEIVFGSSSINLVWAAGGFVGAYLYSLYPLFQRYTRRDLPPRAFLDYAIKVFLGTSAVTVFGNFFLLDYGIEMQFAFAAGLGSIPFVLLNQVRKIVISKMEWPGKIETIGSKDVSIISGITHDYSMRLHEEGIMNVQQLAFANTEILSKRTMFNRKTLLDWKKEAILRLLTGNIPLKKFVENSKENETVYDALTRVGINTISDLSNYLKWEESSNISSIENLKQDENVKSLVKLLGWDENKEEYKYMLIKICKRGEKILKKA